MAGNGIAGFLAVVDVVNDVVGSIISSSQAALILHHAIDVHMGKVQDVGVGIDADFQAEKDRRRRESLPPAPPAPSVPDVSPPIPPNPETPIP